MACTVASRKEMSPEQVDSSRMGTGVFGMGSGGPSICLRAAVALDKAQRLAWESCAALMEAWQIVPKHKAPGYSIPCKVTLLLGHWVSELLTPS